MITNVVNMLQKTVEILCGTIVFVYLLINYLFSLCLLAVIKILYRLWYSQSFNILWGCDAFMQYNDATTFSPPEAQAMSYFVIRLQGEPNILEIQKRIEDNMFACFKKRIVTKFGYYIWEDDPNFSIEDHVRLHPQTYDNDKSLLKLLTDRTQKPYPKDHSPWEVILIRKQQFNDNFSQQHKEEEEHVFAMRFHHSLGGGDTVQSLSTFIGDDSTTHRFKQQLKVYNEHPKIMSPIVRHNAFVKYLATRKLGSKLTLSTFSAIALNVVQVLWTIPQVIMDCIIQKERNTLHGPELCGRKILGVSELVDIKMFKDIASARNSTLNDVLVCCIAGAIKKEDQCPHSIRAYSPVRTMRPENVGIQNCFVLAKFDMPLTHENANERLPHIRKIMNEYKSSPDLLASMIIFYLASNHIPQFLGKKCLAAFDGTLILSNIVGPDYPISICHNFGTDIFFFPMNFCRKGAVSMSCISYNGKVRLGTVIDRAVATDDAIADRLLSNVIKELKELHKSAVQ